MVLLVRYGIFMFCILLIYIVDSDSAAYYFSSPPGPGERVDNVGVSVSRNTRA